MDVVLYLLWCEPSVIPRPSFECLQYSMHFTSDHKPEARKAQEWGYTTICIFLIFAELFGLNYDFLKSCIVTLPYLLIQSALVLDVTSSTLLRTTVQGERVPCWIAPPRSTIPACVTTPWTLELSVVSEPYSCPACLMKGCHASWNSFTPSLLCMRARKWGSPCSSGRSRGGSMGFMEPPLLKGCLRKYYAQTYSCLLIPPFSKFNSAAWNGDML